MICKALELRDRATFIPLLAVKMEAANGQQRYLLKRSGYSAPVNERDFLVLVSRMDGGRSCYDPYDWGDRTFSVAHGYITENFDDLRDGDVIDVEFILGETAEKKVSEAVDYPV